jgi:hypothetical protein
MKSQNNNYVGGKFTIFVVSLVIFILLFAFLPNDDMEGKGGTGAGGDGTGQGTGAGSGSGTGAGNADGSGTGTGTGGDDSAENTGDDISENDANSAGGTTEAATDNGEGVASSENHDSETDKKPALEDVKSDDKSPKNDKKVGKTEDDTEFAKVEDVPDDKKWDPTAFKLTDKKKVSQKKKTVKKAKSKTTRSSSSAAAISSKYATRNKRGSGDFARKMGATKESEDAVDKGLAWLAKVQNTDGHWNDRGTSNTYPESEFLNATPEAIAMNERQIRRKKQARKNLGKEFLKQKAELSKQIDDVKEQEENKRASKKVDIMEYTAAKADAEKKASETAIKKVKNRVQNEIAALKQETNEKAKAVKQEIGILQNELKTAKANLKKADAFLKGTGGIIHGRKVLRSNGHDIGATGLSVLAFLGAGHTHKNMKSPYHGNVQKALNWLLSRENDKGRFAHQNFYEQGIATMAICEAYGMTKDKRLKLAAQKAVDCIVENIGKNGGYGYGGPGDDTHVASFQVMGLKSGILAGLHVPKETMTKLLQYYKNALNKDGTTGYDTNRGGSPRTARTAVGLFVRMFMKVKNTAPDAVQIAGILDDVGPQVGNQYQIYDGTYAMFQMGGGGYWKRWNARFRDPVIRMQQAAGSWRGRHGAVISTTFYIMSLEVYYRYLPVNR